jgi:hypothetical protein
MDKEETEQGLEFEIPDPTPIDRLITWIKYLFACKKIVMAVWAFFFGVAGITAVGVMNDPNRWELTEQTESRLVEEAKAPTIIPGLEPEAFSEVILENLNDKQHEHTQDFILQALSLRLDTLEKHEHSYPEHRDHSLVEHDHNLSKHDHNLSAHDHDYKLTIDEETFLIEHVDLLH